MTKFYDKPIVLEFTNWVNKYYFYSNPGYTLKSLPELEQKEMSIEELFDIFVSDLKGLEDE